VSCNRAVPVADREPGQGRGTVRGLAFSCYFDRQRVDDRHGDQGDAEVSDLGEQPVQLRLVGDGTAKARRPVASPAGQ
jgi:hypothetical protein